MIGKAVLARWYTPEEKMPEEGFTVVATVSGTAGCVTFEHALVTAEWFNDGLGWSVDGIVSDSQDITVHAWCDIDPYR